MAAILSSKNEKVKVVAILGACFQIQYLLAEEKIWKKELPKYYLLK